MTVDAANARVRACLVRHIFRFHHGVTRLTAKGIRLTVFVRLVAAERTRADEQECDQQERKKSMTGFGVIEVEFWILCDLRRRSLTPAPALQKHAEGDDKQ